jgi:hypothetical protein
MAVEKEGRDGVAARDVALEYPTKIG